MAEFGRVQVRRRKRRWVVFQQVLGEEVVYGNWSCWPQAMSHGNAIVHVRRANPGWQDVLVRRIQERRLRR